MVAGDFGVNEKNFCPPKRMDFGKRVYERTKSGANSAGRDWR